jgi:hypothetical protein
VAETKELSIQEVRWRREQMGNIGSFLDAKKRQICNDELREREKRGEE